MTPGVMSTWWGQTRVMKRMIERGDKTALVLEDDVDFEWDLERLWAGIERKLPKDEDGKEAWDITYLGHCWGGEIQSKSKIYSLSLTRTNPHKELTSRLLILQNRNTFTHYSTPRQVLCVYTLTHSPSPAQTESCHISRPPGSPTLQQSTSPFPLSCTSTKSLLFQSYLP